MGTPRRIYLDHAATTPVRPDVVGAMLPLFGDNGFNPSSQHAEGRRARAALDAARRTVARLLGAKPREIVFTSGGSEADNLAILGVARARKAAGRHVITSAVEHHAVLHAFDVLREDGWEVTVLPVDADGRVAPHRFAEALRPDTTFASIVLANNELGTLNPIVELARIARKRGVVFHTDAVQAPGRLNVDVGELGVDLLSLSAHKFYGPKGSGALYVRAGVPLAPLVVGGGQESGRRSGTENVAGIAGLALALSLATQELPAEEERLRALRDRFEGNLASIEGVRINAAAAPRLPNITSVAFEGADATALLARLDLEGVAVSAGSACAAGSTEPSHVLAALDVPDWVRASTIRFSFGKLNGEEDVTTLSRMLPKVVAAVRETVSYVGTPVVRPASRRPEVRS